MTRRFLIVVGLACAALLAAWYLLLWSPKGAELADAKARVDTAELEAESLELRLSRLLEAKKSVVQLSATAERLELAVPAEPMVAEFILEAHDIAAETGMDFLSITPAPPEVSSAPGVAAQVRLNIQVVGGYFRTLDYLDQLLSMSRIVVLDSVSVVPSDSGESGNDLSVALTGRMFMSQMPSPSGSGTTDGGASTPPPPAPDDQVAAGAAGGSGS